MWQVYQDDDSSQFFAKFVKTHVHLKDYKLKLMKESETTGVPPVRSLMLEFPDDPIGRKIKDEFMLGSDLFMAPILETGKLER